MERSTGILLSVSSLPSKYGIGCFSGSAYAFVDWLKQAGQGYWQILPLGPTGYGDSPYQSFSTYAGNPYYISLEALIEKGLLKEEECEEMLCGEEGGFVDYGLLYKKRLPLLRKAYERSRRSKTQAAFEEAQAAWLNDYALYMALKAHFDQAPFSSWPGELRLRDETALREAGEALKEEIGFHKFLQYTFFTQWKALKAYANSQGIRIIGDIPIYVAMDSADTWANPQLFELDASGSPLAVAGCPPDGFSATGQLWGNPLYRWAYHEETNFSWWMDRLKHCFSLYDVVRVDHFRGFDEFYAVPAGAESAVCGSWRKGPGKALFDRMHEELGQKEVIAEDLGYVTDSVRTLVKDCGFPGMKVLEFAFDSRDTGSALDYLPHNYTPQCVAYTGTHDNETLMGWFGSIKEEERKEALAYLGVGDLSGEALAWAFISLLMRSSASLTIIPMQDYLALDNRARMNTPSSVGKNWKWRLKPGVLTKEFAGRLKEMASRYGRL